MEVWRLVVELSGWALGLGLVVVLAGVVLGVVIAPFVLGWEAARDWWWRRKHGKAKAAGS
jgi:hypothetical protein